MIGNVSELVLGCGRVVGRYIRLTSGGSLEDVDGCERLARMGGAYYHAGLRAEYTFYGVADFPYADDPDADSYVGFRLVRELPGPGGLEC